MIKVTLQNEEKKADAKPFPKLMITEGGKIVLFFEPRIGVALAMTGANWSGIDYFTEWVMEKFTDYNEPITIQNE